MKTLNTLYKTAEDLENFIYQNNISEVDNVLLQIFTGICDRVYVGGLIESIVKIIPSIKIIGSTTSGEIIDGKSISKSTVLSFSIFEKTEIDVYATEIAQTSYETGKRLINKFDTSKKAKVAISFADGLNVNGEELINAFNDYDKELVVAGGLAGDNSEFVDTFVFTHKGILKRGVVVALLISEDLKVATKASFGWENIGKSMLITKAEKNRVYTIDGQNAVSIYAKYLGEDIAQGLPSVGVEFPLILQHGKLSIPRAIMGKYSDGSLSFAGNIETGEKITFGYGNVDVIVNNGKKLYDDSSLHISETIFVYSCMARLMLLGESVNNELLPLHSISSMSGFFTYGEFYSDKKSSSNELLNQTMTILSLSEGTESTITREIPTLQDKSDRRKRNLTLKALSHLVSQTSKELEEINNSLENRVAREVAKNRKNEQVMLQQSKLAQMGEMISMIAHQWRQPLAAIGSLSQALSLKSTLGTLTSETVLKLSSDITEHSQYLSTTIDDFREFFRPKKEKKDTNFKDIIESVLKIIEPSIVTKNIKLIKEYDTNCEFYSYPNELKQVLLNLLKNAEDALLEKKIDNPFISIKTYTLDKTHFLVIGDNAGGVASSHQSKLFEPYFSTKTKKDGTGLGLYMSKIIVEEHCGGLLYLKNSSKGAEFYIEIKENADV